MKSIKDIATETGVSVQTVYRKLKCVKELSEEVITEKVGGITYFTEKGEHLILEVLNSVKPMLNDVKRAESEEILFLREQNKLLTEKLASLADELIRLNENNQTLLREQNLKSLTSPTSEKVSLWNKLFSRGKI
jgi:DNA-binding transcriptional regulator YhcF (GntR family)